MEVCYTTRVLYVVLTVSGLIKENTVASLFIDFVGIKTGSARVQHLARSFCGC